METIDSGKITIFTALDMSAAFDTLDHATLLHRLEHTFGLSGFVISWIRSYLTNRSSFVEIDSSSSPSTPQLSTGVPQGYVLDPLLFVLFISPVANVINPDLAETSNLVSFHQYTDDTQLYIGTNASSTLVHPSGCLNRILHTEGQQLASEQWSSPQSIQVWSHCFFQPKVQTSLSLGWINFSCRFTYQAPIINQKFECLSWL